MCIFNEKAKWSRYHVNKCREEKIINLLFSNVVFVTAGYDEDSDGDSDDDDGVTEVTTTMSIAT